MDAPQASFYTEPWTETLADVRDEMNRRREHNPDPTRLAAETGHPEHEVLSVLELLRNERGEVLA